MHPWFHVEVNSLHILAYSIHTYLYMNLFKCRFGLNFTNKIYTVKGLN